MYKTFLLTCITATLLKPELKASPQDTSVIVSSAITNVEFVWNSKLSRVDIKQTKETNYLAEGYDASLPIAEIYNEHISIDGVFHKLNGKIPFNFKPSHSYYSEDNIFYSDARICYFPVYLKEKGNKASVTFEKTIDDPRYFTSIYFSEPYKVLEKKFIIKVPRWMKVDFKELNFGKLNILKSTSYDKDDDADIITYIAKNIPSQQQEKNSPGPSYLYPHLMFLAKSANPNGQTVTYFNTLADQYKWYTSLVKSIENDQATLKSKALEITNGIADGMQQVKSIFYWVQNNIRYIAFEDGIAGFRPEKADEVLRKKYGDCKGMAHLTQSLLKSLGYDARLCWIGTNHIAYNYETPSMAVDNHMICALNFKGKWYYLDATETYLAFGEYAERIQGRQVLIEDGEKYILNTIPKTDVSQNLDFEKKVVTLSGPMLSGIVNHNFKGEEKEFWLGRLKGTRKSELDNALNRYFSYNNDNVVSQLQTSSLDDTDGDLKINYSIGQKSGINMFGDDYYIEMDLRKEMNDYAIDTLIRKHDYWLPYKFNIQREAELIVPDNYMVSAIPANLNVSTPDYDFKISYTVLPGKVAYKKAILIKNPRISKSQFATWNNDIKKLNDAYNETLILKPKQ